MGTTIEQTWSTICPVADLISHVGSCALVGAKQVAIFYLQDEDAIYAIDNYDPISGANVISRGLVGDLKGELVVASPLYKQHFSLKTGRCLEREDVQLDTFEVRIHDGNVELAVPSP